MAFHPSSMGIRVTTRRTSHASVAYPAADDAPHTLVVDGDTAEVAEAVEQDIQSSSPGSGRTCRSEGPTWFQAGNRYKVTAWTSSHRETPASGHHDDPKHDPKQQHV